MVSLQSPYTLRHSQPVAANHFSTGGSSQLATKHIQSIEHGYSKATAFMNCRRSVRVSLRSQHAFICTVRAHLHDLCSRFRYSHCHLPLSGLPVHCSGFSHLGGGGGGARRAPLTGRPAEQLWAQTDGVPRLDRHGKGPHAGQESAPHMDVLVCTCSNVQQFNI